MLRLPSPLQIVVNQTKGLLGVGAGGSTSSTLLSNTFGQVPITI